MAEGPPLPLVLVPACNRLLGAYSFQVVGQKYVDAVRLAGALPLVVPDGRGATSSTPCCDLADGVFLTGSPSNVHPGQFGEAVHDPSLPLDAARDAWTLPLIPEALERGMPLLAICRGFQEVNVALGGSLHQAVQEQPGHADHRAARDAPPEVQYGPAHERRRRARRRARVDRRAPTHRGQFAARPGREAARARAARRGARARRPGRGLLGARGEGLQPVRCNGTPSGRRRATRCRCSCWRPSAHACRAYRDRHRDTVA